jgi:hypothetical protein
MARKIELINRALDEIGIASSTNMPAEVEDTLSALPTLQSMMARWLSQGINLGYNFQEPTTTNPNLKPDLNDESNLPLWTEDAVVYELGLKLGSRYGKPVSRELKVMAKEAMDELLIAIVNVPQMPRPGTMPIGSGYKRNFTYNRFYRTSDAVNIQNYQEQQSSS